MATPATRSAPHHKSVPADPWALVSGQPYINHQALAAAIEEDLTRTPEPDFRPRLLIRD